jgi:hypothetical protein
MSHMLLKIRGSEAAIYFSKEGKFETIMGEGKLHKDLVVPFTLCYSISANAGLRKLFLNTLVEELKKESNCITENFPDKKREFQTFANVLLKLESESHLGEEPLVEVFRNMPKNVS